MFKGIPKGQQLRLLKRQGIVSISLLATRALVVATALGVFLSVAPGLIAEFERALKLGALPSPRVFIIPVVVVVLATSLGVVIAGALSTALQSRGAVGWDLLQRTRRESKGFLALLAYLVTLAVSFAVAGIVFFVCVADFVSLARATSIEQALSGYTATLSTAVKLVVVGAAVYAILAAVLTRFLFLVRNRVRSERGAE